MVMINRMWVSSWTFVVLITISGSYGAVTQFKPNILIFLADDLGYGDVGCFGNTTVNTPNIDAITRDGAKLTHHLTAESVCTPSRAALLTGRYPIRSGMIPTGSLRVNLFVANRCGLPSNETTIAEIAKSSGYKTALIGKWHLGLSRDWLGDNHYHPLNQGFDYYYGHILTNMKDWGNEGDRVVLSQRPNFYKACTAILIATVLTAIFLLKMKLVRPLFVAVFVILVCTPIIYGLFIFENLTLLNAILMRNFDVVEQPIKLETLSERYTKEGIKFLEERSRDNNPFLLLMSWDHVHTALKTSEEFRGKSKHGRYGDAIEEMDSHTGKIMTALDRFGFGRNTMVYFTSDNGAHLEESGITGESYGGSNGIFKGGKTHGSVDGGIRVPSSVRFPGIIPSNTVIDEPTMQMDMFTTIANLVHSKIPEDRTIDGKDILPLLRRKEKISPHEYFFHYCGGKIQAVRHRPRTGSKVWKLAFEMPEYLPGQNRCHFACLCQWAIVLDPPHLFELTSDPSEDNPIAYDSNREYQEIVQKMKLAVEEHRNSVVPVEAKMSTYNILWRPHLQPCCNFPYCSCSDPVYPS